MADERDTTVRRVTLHILAAVFSALGIWRGVEAGLHFVASRAIVDDPSIRELEEVSAALEGIFAVVLLIHAAVAFNMARRGVLIEPRLTLLLAVFAAALLGASMTGLAPVLRIPGVYPVAIVAGAAILCRVLPSSWLSLYLGAVIGSVAALVFTSPSLEPFAFLGVVAPFVVLTFAGGALGRWMRKRSARQGSRAEETVP